MTRINLVPPQALVRQHLVAEYRELPRIFALVRDAEGRGWRPETVPGGILPAYVLGTGHCRFFYNKLGFLAIRFGLLAGEMARRGYAPLYTEPPTWVHGLAEHWFGSYEPTPEAIRLNAQRINTRLREMGLTEHQLTI